MEMYNAKGRSWLERLRTGSKRRFEESSNLPGQPWETDRLAAATQWTIPWKNWPLSIQILYLTCAFIHLPVKVSSSFLPISPCGPWQFRMGNV
jgi:hypothetical protein